MKKKNKNPWINIWHKTFRNYKNKTVFIFWNKMSKNKNWLTILKKIISNKNNMMIWFNKIKMKLKICKKNWINLNNLMILYNWIFKSYRIMRINLEEEKIRSKKLYKKKTKIQNRMMISRINRSKKIMNYKKLTIYWTNN